MFHIIEKEAMCKLGHTAYWIVSMLMMLDTKAIASSISSNITVINSLTIGNTESDGVKSNFSEFETPSAPPNSPVSTPREQQKIENLENTRNSESEICESNDGDKYKTPKRTNNNINDINKTNRVLTNKSKHIQIPIAKLNTPPTNLINKLENCEISKKQGKSKVFLTEIKLPKHSSFFYHDLPSLENKLPIKKGGSHGQKQIDGLGMSLDEEPSITLKLSDDDVKICYSDKKSRGHSFCRYCGDRLFYKSQLKTSKTPSISISPNISKIENISEDKSVLNKGFARNERINLTAQHDKEECFQLSYVGLCKNTTAYDESKNVDELFLDLLDPIELNLLNWSMTSETGI